MSEHLENRPLASQGDLSTGLKRLKGAKLPKLGKDSCESQPFVCFVHFVVNHFGTTKHTKVTKRGRHVA